MEMKKTLPKSFFEKVRPEAPKNTLEKTESFKFSDEKGVLEQKYKDRKIITLLKKTK